MKGKQRDLVLSRVIADLDELTLHCDALDSASIVAESSVDESILVGSPDALVRVAGELLRVAAAFEKRDEEQLAEGGIVGRGERMSDRIKFFFDEDATVWPVCICVTPSREVTKLVQGEFDS